MFPDEPSDILVKARLRLLWRRCGAVEPVQAAPAGGQPIGPTVVPSSDASPWSDAFPGIQ